MRRQVLIRIFAVFNILESITPLALAWRYTHGTEKAVFLLGANIGIVLLLWFSAYGIWRCRKWGLYLILLQSVTDVIYRLPSVLAWTSFLGKPIREEFYFTAIEVFFFLLAVIKIVFFSQSRTRTFFSQLTQTI